MKRSKKDLLSFILIFVFSGLAIYGAFVFLKQKTSFDPKKTKLRIYTNVEYGFQFQYPDSIWGTILEVQHSPGDACLHEVRSEHLDPNIEIDIFKNVKGIKDIPGLEKMILKLFGIPDWEKVSGGFPCGLNDINETDIDGHAAIIFNYTECDENSAPGGSVVQVFVCSPKYIFKMSLEGNVEMGDWLLNTFKTIDD